MKQQPLLHQGDWVEVSRKSNRSKRPNKCGKSNKELKKKSSRRGSVVSSPKPITISSCKSFSAQRSTTQGSEKAAKWSPQNEHPPSNTDIQEEESLNDTPPSHGRSPEAHAQTYQQPFFVDEHKRPYYYGIHGDVFYIDLNGAVCYIQPSMAPYVLVAFHPMQYPNNLRHPSPTYSRLPRTRVRPYWYK